MQKRKREPTPEGPLYANCAKGPLITLAAYVLLALIVLGVLQ